MQRPADRRTAGPPAASCHRARPRAATAGRIRASPCLRRPRSRRWSAPPLVAARASDSGNQRSNRASWVLATSSAPTLAEGVWAWADGSSATAIAAANAAKNCLRLRRNEGKEEPSCITSLQKRSRQAVPSDNGMLGTPRWANAWTNQRVHDPGEGMTIPRDFDRRIVRLGSGDEEIHLEMILRRWTASG